MKKIALVLALPALAASPAGFAQDAESAAAVKDYTCWSLLTEPEENAGYSELFYLGYALGRANIELKDEDAYKQVLADVLKRCQGEPDTRVLDAFDAAIKARNS